MIITVSWCDWLDGIEVSRFAHFGDAIAATVALPPTHTAYVVDTGSPAAWREFGEYCTKNLVQIANALLEDGGEPANYAAMRHDDALRLAADAITRRSAMGEVRGSEKPDDDPRAENGGAARPFLPVALGEFRAVRDGTKLADLLRLAGRGLTYDGIAGIAGIDRAAVVNRLRVGLGRGHGIGHVLDGEGRVSLVLPPGTAPDDMFVARAEGTERRVRAARAPEPRREASSRTGKDPKSAADFRALREGTIRAAIAALMDGTRTTAEVAEAVGQSPGNTHAHIYCLWRDCGLGFSYDSERRVTLLLPEGVASAVKSAEAVPAGAA